MSSVSLSLRHYSFTWYKFFQLAEGWTVQGSSSSSEVLAVYGKERKTGLKGGVQEERVCKKGSGCGLPIAVGICIHMLSEFRQMLTLGLVFWGDRSQGPSKAMFSLGTR